MKMRPPTRRDEAPGGARNLPLAERGHAGNGSRASLGSPPVRRAGGASLVLLIVLSGLPAGAGAERLSDPTRPYGRGETASAAERGPVLQSTLVAPGRKVAVIDGKRLRVGDRYDGAVITAITPYEVRLRDDGREISLRLLPKVTDREGAVQ